jgi:hypothetical protein
MASDKYQIKCVDIRPHVVGTVIEGPNISFTINNTIDKIEMVSVFKETMDLPPSPSPWLWWWPPMPCSGCQTVLVKGKEEGMTGFSTA